MATVHEIEQRLFSWAPRESAMDWDNVGHLVGDPEQEVERILVALDITERVLFARVGVEPDGMGRRERPSTTAL